VATADEQARVHLRIEGRVQGVYFRASTAEKARQLGITGWVMNCPDGSVEALAQGTRAKLEELVAWCHQGPPGAQVRKVHAAWKPVEDDFEGFRIRHSRW
jgi:acylphosphatase